MLTRTEGKVMTAILAARGDKTSFLVSPDDIYAAVKDYVTRSELEAAVEGLSEDGYFDLILSDRKGEKVYCITLTEKGKGYLRSVKEFRRNVLFRVCLSAALAVFSFVIGLILKKVF